MSIQQGFEDFHRNNPHVYRLLVRFARELRDSGMTKSGIRMVWERMRWEMTVKVYDHAKFKLNNNYTSRYVRLIMQQEEDLNGFFEVRDLRAA